MIDKNEIPLTAKQGALQNTEFKFTPFIYKNPIDYILVNRAAIHALPDILCRWLPTGKRCGHEYIAPNPRRYDRTLGSFKINMLTGKWADFSTGDKGGDVISLAAFLFGIKQSEAAKNLADMLGIGGNSHAR